MTMARVEVTETVDIPDDAEIAIAPTGAVQGFRLADGRLIRAWIAYEIEEEDGTCRNLTYDEMCALDIGAAEDTERHIQHVDL